MDMGDQVYDLAVRFGPKVLSAGAIMVAGYVAGGWAARGSRRVLMKLQLEAPVRALAERGIRIAVLALFAVLALQNLGIELLPLIAGLGIAGAGVALALQGVLGNVVAGLTILLTRPFRVGDYISIVKEEGEVLDIKLFNTILGHADLSKVIIPNRKIVGEILHNYGQIRQVSVTAVVAFDADLDKACRTLTAAVNANPRVLKDPAPVIGVARLTESGVALGVSPWVKLQDFGAASSEINETVVATLRANGIAMPVPHREIRLVGNASPADAALRASA